ncbi:MAG: hypothetical protein ACLPN6_30225 [Streptosporangiaceae bacterium]|jgi:hypothetical protein
MLNRPEFGAYFPTCQDGTLMPARYDQDTNDDHRKEDHGWLPHGTGGALQRSMEWVMYTAAGLLSGAIARRAFPMPSGPPHPARC